MDCCTPHTCQSLHPKLSPICHFLEVSSCICHAKADIFHLLFTFTLEHSRFWQVIPVTSWTPPQAEFSSLSLPSSGPALTQAGTRQETLWDCVFFLNGAETFVIFFAPCWKTPIKQPLWSNSGQLVRRTVWWSLCLSENLIWSLQKALFNKMYSSLK